MADLLYFAPRIGHAYSHEFVAPDGRYWQANAYLTDDDLDRLEHGRSYTIPELKNLGLAQYGLPIKSTQKPPVSVVYLKAKIAAGQE